jgi:hypothetical protein
MLRTVRGSVLVCLDSAVVLCVICESETRVGMCIPKGRAEGFTNHSLRHAFRAFCINSRIPREVVDAWQGHSPDRSAGGAYYRLSPEASQRFMTQVPFGTGEPANKRRGGLV